jgi:ABC-type uncharacterized transport system substrate-binding protein
MRELGYVDGENIHIEVRWARGDNSHIAALAAEIVARRPQVIVTNSEPAIRAVKDVAGGCHLLGLDGLIGLDETGI